MSADPGWVALSLVEHLGGKKLRGLLAHFNGDEVATGAEPVLVEDSVGVSGQVIAEWPFTEGRYKVALQYGTGPAYDFRSVLGPPVGMASSTSFPKSSKSVE